MSKRTNGSRNLWKRNFKRTVKAVRKIIEDYEWLSHSPSHRTACEEWLALWQVKYYIKKYKI